MRVDDAPVGQGGLQLAAQLAHVHVHRAIARPQVAAPDGPVELLAGYDRAEPPGHRDKEFELAHRQRERLSRGEHKPLLEPNLEPAGIEDLWDVRTLPDGRHDA